MLLDVAKDQLVERGPTVSNDCRMSFDDFARHFTHLDLVHVGPDDWMSEPALHSKQPWRAVLARRRWRAGYNAGGGPAYTETTAMNPQFHIQIPRSASNKCHVVVSVTQYYEPIAPENKKKKRLFAIGFAVYEVPHAMTRLSPQFVMEQVRLVRPFPRTVETDRHCGVSTSGRATAKYFIRHD